MKRNFTKGFLKATAISAFLCGGLLAASTWAADENLLDVHDFESASYNGDCVSCHAEVLQEQTKDPRIPSFHQAMLIFTPGFNPARGQFNQACVQCHFDVDLVADSAGSLRKQVDPTLCALCHGQVGPGQIFYNR